MTGMDAVFGTLRDHIRQGPLAGLFHRGPSIEDAKLLRLQVQLEELKSTIEAETLHSDDTLALLHAIDSLDAAIVTCSSFSGKSSPAQVRAVHLWPTLVKRRVHELIREEHPVALVVLAHFCLLLHWSARDIWCFERWAQSVMGEIVEKISSTRWADSIGWPLQMLDDESE
ncbi:hypothetical protein ACHAQA_003811 [Verticillium albo-atrum]